MPTAVNKINFYCELHQNLSDDIEGVSLRLTSRPKGPTYACIDIIEQKKVLRELGNMLTS